MRWIPRTVVCILAATTAVLAAAGAWACGNTPHVGPTGLVIECDGLGRPEVGPWRIAVHGGIMSSDLDADGTELGIEQTAASVRIERRAGNRVVLGVSAGSIVTGKITLPGNNSVDLGVGWTAGASLSVLAFAEQPKLPFVIVGASYAYSSTGTSGPIDGTFIGKDIRVGVAVGKSFGPVRLYVAGRGFGGGFTWKGGGTYEKGGDAHNYQVGAGLALDLPSRFDLVAELMPLGEHSTTFGIGRSF